MPPAFHVDGIIAGLETYPDPDVISTATEEARKQRSSAQTQLAITARKLEATQRRSETLKPGQLPPTRG